MRFHYCAVTYIDKLYSYVSNCAKWACFALNLETVLWIMDFIYELLRRKLFVCYTAQKSVPLVSETIRKRKRIFKLTVQFEPPRGLTTLSVESNNLLIWNFQGYYWYSSRKTRALYSRDPCVESVFRSAEDSCPKLCFELCTLSKSSTNYCAESFMCALLRRKAFHLFQKLLENGNEFFKLTVQFEPSWGLTTLSFESNDMLIWNVQGY